MKIEVKIYNDEDELTLDDYFESFEMLEMAMGQAERVLNKET